MILYSVEKLWEFHSQNQVEDAEPWWNCLTPITDEEIQQTLDKGDFLPMSEMCGSQYQGKRDWHIRRIATLVKALNDGHRLPPAFIFLNGRRPQFGDGAHRLAAHHHLKHTHMEVELDNRSTWTLG